MMIKNSGTRLAAKTRWINCVFQRYDTKILLDNKILNTYPIVEEALENFFDELDKKDFFKTLTGETAISTNVENVGARDQLSLDIRTSPQLRYQVDQLITFAESKFTLEKFVGFLIYLGQLTITAGENPLAIEIHEKIINLCGDKAGMADIIANALLAIGEIYSRQAQWELSISYLEKSIKIFSNENDTKGNIHCQNILGTIHGDQGNLNKAKEHFENALIALQEIKDTTLIGKVEINLGIINNMQGNYHEALSYLKRALLNFEKVDNLKRIAEIKQNLGMVYIKKQDYNSALNEFNESINISIRSSYLQNLGITYINKAFVYVQLKDFDLAGAFAEKAMEIADKINDKLSIAEVYKIKGIINRNKNNLEVSENSLLTSYRLNKDLKNQLNLAEVACELGILFKQKGEIEKSNQYLNEALGYFRKINSEADISYLEKLISN
ncbi:MAG: tetratricopeptide repeat protein [Ignavibacteriaceae bacterium]|nr:tetratricopeptide repeat protein [Ignavibacteriaceae bacterium]